MKPIYLKIKKSKFEQIKNFLLQSSVEQVVFLLIAPSYQTDKIIFETEDIYFVPQRELNGSEYSVGLKEAAQAKVIKWAWTKGACLAEIHSHPFSKQATAFSYTDIAGLEEFVPHLWWRLKHRPYLAMVFGENDYDAIVWLDDPTKPRRLAGILVEDRLIEPTNKTTGFKYE